MFTVYVLYSIGYGAIYIGFSKDPETRLLSHNHPLNKGWTKKFQPWMIIHTEDFTIKSRSIETRKRIKILSRENVY